MAVDSLGARVAGSLMLEVALRTGLRSVLVDDDAIRGAQAWLWERLRIVCEPGGATALAALLAGVWRPPPGAQVGVLLCGANTDPATVTADPRPAPGSASG